MEHWRNAERCHGWKTLLLMLCIPASLSAQAPSAGPCVILKVPNGRNYAPAYNKIVFVHPETLKGTCYYDDKGAITHWIVRWWSDETGRPTGEKAFVGYPAVLQEQKRYNHEMLRTFPGGHDGPPPYGNCQTNGDEFEVKKYGPCWDQKVLQGRRGWIDFNRYLNTPKSILETGELDTDTLRIPLFLAGIPLLYAESHFRSVCSSADDDYDDWLQKQGETTSAETDASRDASLSFCDPAKKAPKNQTLWAYQSVLRFLGSDLEQAHAAARDYEELIERYYMPVTPEVPPEGLAVQLAKLRVTIQIYQRDADDWDKQAEAFEKQFPDLFTHPNIR